MKKIKTLLNTSVFCALIYSVFLLQACDDDEPKDTLAPEISFANVTGNMTVWNTVEISLEANDDRGIDQIEVFADGMLIATLTESPFETTWDSNIAEDGPHTLKARVTDMSGNTAEAEVSVNVLNTLVTLNIAADQLYHETEFSEHGFVFLSDENGNVIAHQEYQNGNTIVFKSGDFDGEKFFLTEALIETRPGEDLLRMWTFAEIERGKNWVVVDDREDDNETYAGEANLTFTNVAPNSSYRAFSNGDDAGADELNLTSSIRIHTSPSKLYVTRDSHDDETNAPVAYNLYSNIVVGNNTINLSQVNKDLTKFTVNVPQGSLYSTMAITGYPVANNYTEPYSLGNFHSGTEILSYDIFYPGNAFPAYYTFTDYETEDIYYTRGSKSPTPTLPMITADVDLTFANSKLTYSASGNLDFLSTQYENEAENAYWSFILPAGSNKTVPVLQLPDDFPVFDMPAFGFPPHYTVYDFEEIADYESLKTFIRNSTRSVDALYQAGKNYVDIVYKNPVPGGRSKGKTSRFVKAFGRNR